MRLIYDVPNEVSRYGSLKFFESVRDNLLCAVDAGNLEIAECNIRQFYQDYAWAYIVATKYRNPVMLDSLLMQVTCNPVGEWTPVTDSSGMDILLGSQPGDKPMPKNMLIIDDHVSTAEDQTVTFLSSEESDEMFHYAALEAVKTQLTKELSTQTGLAALIDSMLPGAMISYIGESFDGMVVICDDALLGCGGSF